jgi:hypothetical protein
VNLGIFLSCEEAGMALLKIIPVEALAVTPAM